MITVSVMYPNDDGGTFDMDYYLSKHMELVAARVGAAIKNKMVVQGLAGGAPGAPASFRVMTTLQFESVDAFQSAFAAHANEIMGDIPNFTNLTPTIQISDVVAS